MALALDIGGTNIRIAFVSRGKVRKKERHATPKKREKLLEKIANLINKYQSIERQDKIGISLAGFVNKGKVIKSPNLSLDGFDMKKYLEKKTGAKIYLENDARCAGTAEKYYGKGKNYKNFIYLTIGTGIGGAIFINGKLYSGKGHAGEFGHMIVNGKEFEKESSGRAFGRRHMKIFTNLAAGINDLIYSFDPQLIVIGGGLSKNKKIINKAIEKTRKEDILHRKTNIKISALGDDAGLIGAGMITKKNFLK